jgi:hypothetical protein
LDAKEQNKLLQASANISKEAQKARASLNRGAGVVPLLALPSLALQAIGFYVNDTVLKSPKPTLWLGLGLVVPAIFLVRHIYKDYAHVSWGRAENLANFISEGYSSKKENNPAAELEKTNSVPKSGDWWLGKPNL